MLINELSVIIKLLKPLKVYGAMHFKLISGFSIDSRTIKENEAFIAIKGKHQDGHNFIKEAIDRGAALIISQLDVIRKPNVTFCVVGDTYKAMGKIISHIRCEKRPFVYGITGSVGKTTTKDMLGFLLEPRFKVLTNKKTENNILGLGKTFFSLADEKVVVTELGTNHPGEIKELAEILYPDAGIITFIKPAHLEGLKDLKGIFEEKISLLKVNPKIKAVLNRDDPYLRRVKFPKEISWFGIKKPPSRIENYLYAKLLKAGLTECFFLVQGKFKLRLNTPFCGFIYNYLAAICAAQLLGEPLEELVEKLSAFGDFGEGRAKISKKDNFTIFNDAYNANPYSFTEALRVVRRFSQRKIAVVGDMLELGDKSVYYHRLLAKNLLKSKFEYILTLGKCTVHLEERLKELGYKNVFHFSTHNEISQFIKEQAKGEHLIFLKGSRRMELEKVFPSS